MFTVVWVYVALIISAGCGLGLVFGWGMSGLVSRIFSAQTGIALKAVLTGWEFALAGGVAIIGLVLATLPALALYRRPVIETLTGRGTA